MNDDNWTAFFILFLPFILITMALVYIDGFIYGFEEDGGPVIRWLNSLEHTPDPRTTVLSYGILGWLVVAWVVMGIASIF